LFEFGKSKKEGCLTDCLTGRKTSKKKGRFQRVGHGLFRMKSTGIIYAVFKSAGKTRWKNLGTDAVRQARKLSGEEIQPEAKVDWKRARTGGHLSWLAEDSFRLKQCPASVRQNF
jgi:hypothetical protein